MRTTGRPNRDPESVPGQITEGGCARGGASRHVLLLAALLSGGVWLLLAIPTALARAHAECARVDGEADQPSCDPAIAEIEYRHGQVLSDTGFLLPGRELRLANDIGGGFPASAFQRIYLKVGDTIIRVETPADLAGHVRIASAGMALQYVRLFTSPATARAVRPTWLEVMPVSAVDKGFLFGLQPPSPGPNARWHEYGIVPDAQWQRSGLVPPAVFRLTDGHLVLRALFRPTGEHIGTADVVHWIAQSVSTDGKVKEQDIGQLAVSSLHLGVTREI